MTQMPAIGMVALPGRREKMIALAREIEDRGFEGIYVPSLSACLAFCQAVLAETSRIKVATSVLPIYLQHPRELAATAALMHELSGGRFRLGIGVSHAPVYDRLGLKVGKPVSDMREYVAAMRDFEPETGELPPVVLATLRNVMLGLARDAGNGAVWANGARSYIPQQLADGGITPSQDYFIGNMLPTVVDDDRNAGAAVHKRTINGYLHLPNYRNYWREAGYAEGIDAVEQAIAGGAQDGLADLMSEEWLSDVTLYGSGGYIREQVEESFAAGVTPILVPSSTSGGMAKAISEVFEIFK